MRSLSGTRLYVARRMLYSTFADVTSTTGTTLSGPSSTSSTSYDVQCHVLTIMYSGSEPASFTLKYNIMPYVGVLTTGEAARTEPIPFPPSQAPTE